MDDNFNSNPTDCLIISPYLKYHNQPNNSSNSQQYVTNFSYNVHELHQEAIGLAAAINLTVARDEVIQMSKIVPASLIGKGKIADLKQYIDAECIQLTIVNQNISPIQQRNLELGLGCKVIDRTALILEIFGERASTREGKLQVELAALEYQKSRLVRSWTHLERQRGGHGVMGGPGEKQIESDRRQINDRIKRIKDSLNIVKKTRLLHRQSRKNIPFPIVAIVGYTNAGKSTLFNILTNSDVMAKDMLFATLDPTMRSVILPSGMKIIISDTVGFIANLPTELIAAFRATLEEVLEADIILHVRDITHPSSASHKKDVLQILDDLGLSEVISYNMIEVQNKIDLLDPEDAQKLIAEKSKDNRIVVSAVENLFIDDLLHLIERKITELKKFITKKITVILPVSEGKLISWIHDNCFIDEKNYQDENILIACRVLMKDLYKIEDFIVDSI